MTAADANTSERGGKRSGREGVLVGRRAVLITLLVVSAAAFVVGVSIEASAGDEHAEAPPAVEPEAERGDTHAGEGTERGGAHTEPASGEAEDEDEKLVGVDLEAAPFVVLAAAFSVALAIAVWLRPGAAPLLALVAVAMGVFAALDVREVIHQLDEDDAGLALLAGVVAVLHLAAAVAAVTLVRSPPGAARDSLA